MKKNMKIEINKDQPLADVVRELERLGFDYDGKLDGIEINEVVTYGIDSTYVISTKYGKNHFMIERPIHNLTTLDELKEMK